MATIRKRNRKWHVQIRRKDHPTLTRSFDMRKHARAWAREEESKLDRIQAWQSPVSMHRLTLGDIVRRYRDEEVPKKRGADVETTILNAFLRSELVNKKLSEIEPAHFTAWRDKRLQHVRPATICRELGIYQHMFGVAIKEWGLPLATNPLAEVRKPKRDDRIPHRIPDSMVLQLEEAATKGRTPLVVPLLRFALETAMRRGELSGVAMERHQPRETTPPHPQNQERLPPDHSPHSRSNGYPVITRSYGRDFPGISDHTKCTCSMLATVVPPGKTERRTLS